MAAPIGNKNAAKEWEGAIKRALARRGEGDWHRGLDKIADKLCAKAEEGDGPAWKEIGERLDGRSRQEVIGSFSHKHTHSAEPVSDSLAWLDGIVRGEPLSKAQEPLLN